MSNRVARLVSSVEHDAVARGPLGAFSGALHEALGHYLDPVPAAWSSFDYCSADTALPALTTTTLISQVINTPLPLYLLGVAFRSSAYEETGWTLRINGSNALRGLPGNLEEIRHQISPGLFELFPLRLKLQHGGPHTIELVVRNTGAGAAQIQGRVAGYQVGPGGHAQ